MAKDAFFKVFSEDEKRQWEEEEQRLEEDEREKIEDVEKEYPLLTKIFLK